MLLFLGISTVVSALGLLPGVAACSQSLLSAREGSMFLSREAVFVGLSPWAGALSLSRFKPLSRDRALVTEGPATLWAGLAGSDDRSAVAGGCSGSRDGFLDLSMGGTADRSASSPCPSSSVASSGKLPTSS